MNNVQEQYKIWTTDEYFDKADRDELLALTDEKEISDRFYTDLSFGTAGMRGVLGIGTNRMNKYMVRLAAKGLAISIEKAGKAALDRGVAIAYDSRIMSPEFALETALVLAKCGIKSYMFDSLRPTPELSFAIRHYNCIAGVNVTASHNPQQYNGYKVYWEDGSQISKDLADEIVANIASLGGYAVEVATEEEARNKGLLVTINEECDAAFIAEIKKSMFYPELCKDNGKNLSIVYTALHGAGTMLIERLFRETGFANMFTVPEQAEADGRFPTVKSPNPESKDAFELCIKYGKEKGAELLLATDPDADRIGVYVLNENGEYVGFNGNQIGAMLLNYICTARASKGILPKKAVAVKSLATGDLANAVAKLFDVSLRITPVGFKYIGEQMEEMKDNNSGEFILGFEESYGYLAGTYARDKDAVGTAVLIAEAALYYKEKEGKNLAMVMEELYKKVGYFRDEQISYTLYGQEGLGKIASIMSTYASHNFKSIGGAEIASIEDFNKRTKLFVKNGLIEALPYEKLNIYKLNLEGGGFVIARPSGTEPKIKFYFSLRGDTMEALEHACDIAKKEFLEPVKEFLE